MEGNLPKIAHCRLCRQKPAEKIWAMGYSDKDDELYLTHYCRIEGKKVYFPELGKHPFTAVYVNGQRPLVREAWNKLQEEPQSV